MAFTGKICIQTFKIHPKGRPDEMYMAKNKKDIKIIVAAHKKYHMPEDSCYLPLHVGKKERMIWGIWAMTRETISQRKTLITVS